MNSVRESVLEPLETSKGNGVEVPMAVKNLHTHALKRFKAVTANIAHLQVFRQKATVMPANIAAFSVSMEGSAAEGTFVILLHGTGVGGGGIIDSRSSQGLSTFTVRWRNWFTVIPSG